jgi:hypothetical protein
MSAGNGDLVERRWAGAGLARSGPSAVGELAYQTDRTCESLRIRSSFVTTTASRSLAVATTN